MTKTKKIYVFGMTGGHEFEYPDKFLYAKMKKIVTKKLDDIIKEEPFVSFHFLLDGEPFAGHILASIMKDGKYKDNMNEDSPYHLYMNCQIKTVRTKKAVVHRYDPTFKAGESLNSRHRKFRLSMDDDIQPIVELYEMDKKSVKANDYLKMVHIIRTADVIIAFPTREKRAEFIPKKTDENVTVHRYTSKFMKAYSGMSTRDEYAILKELGSAIEQSTQEDWTANRKNASIDGDTVLKAQYVLSALVTP